MDLRPFTRKNKTVEEIPPAPTDEFAQFYSNDPQYAVPVESVITTPAVSEPGPTITTDGDSAPGWYPDSQDEGLLRYWDGYHLTGQTLRIDAPEPERDESTSGSTATSEAASATPTAQDDSVVNQVSEQPPAPPATAEAPPAPSFLPPPPATPAEPAPAVPPAPPAFTPQPPQTATSSFTPLIENPVSETHDEGDVVGAQPDTAPTDGPGSSFTVLASSATTEPPSPTIPLGPAGDDSPTGEPADATTDTDTAAVADEVGVNDAGAGSVTGSPAGGGANHWAEETEKTVARAESLDTPEAWQDVARAAGVVTDMAQVMRAAADTSQTAARMERAARDAERRAETARLKAEESRQAVQKTAQVASEAAKAAKEAAHAAAKAKQIAEQNAQEAPELAEAAELAGRAAAEARRRARAIEEIVAKARAADTPGAWSKAHNRADTALETPGGKSTVD
jgi:hypothetical protein